MTLEILQRGPIADLIEIRERMNDLATPKKVHSVTVKDPTKVNTYYNFEIT